MVQLTLYTVFISMLFNHVTLTIISMYLSNTHCNNERFQHALSVILYHQTLYHQTLYHQTSLSSFSFLGYVESPYFDKFGG